MGKRILVITGGDDLAGVVPGPEPPFDLVIAVDGGLHLAEAMGLSPDIVVGDLDSASPEAVARARGRGARIEGHPTEKDHTDLELALSRALEEGASGIAVFGGSGGRPDHWFANLSLLAAAARSGAAVTAEMGGWSIAVVVPGHPYAEERQPGELMSLLPVDGNVCGITTDGLTYPLHAEDLPAGSSRGVSNVTCGGPVRIEIQDGTLLVMRAPYPPGPNPRDEAIR